MFKRLAFLALCTLVAGCGPSGTALSSGAGSLAVGDTNATYFTSRDGGMLFVVWVKHTNGVSGGGGSGTSSSPDKAVLRGYYQYGDGPKVEWNCETTDGKRGKVNVGGKAYDLANGGLFLVDLSSSEPAVTQLNRDLSKIKNQKELEALATTDSEMQKFVGGQKDALNTKSEEETK